MRLDDLDLRELLDAPPRGGVFRFAGQRALIIDAVALGLLRKELIDTVGYNAARGVLTRLGYAHGWRTAQTLEKAIPWESRRDWMLAGGRLHMLQGQVIFEPLPDGGEPGVARANWHDSYEAEQHLLHIGKSDSPVCWTLCGFASGYMSFCHQREIVCIETRCQGCGDGSCELFAKPKELWGDAITEHLPFYRRDCLDARLTALTGSLKKIEQELERRKHELIRPEAVDPERSPAMKQTIDLARRVARSDTTVLVTGESGVGKERIARQIHEQSARAKGPFIAVNCGAIAESLLESELFGHVKGAFSGAIADRMGLFEAASGGTLFLDEVGEVTPAMQVKLLRALQEREIRPVGESKSRTVDVRIVAATNRELHEEVMAGRFRNDLFYRLRVIELKIPPLRERQADILPLARAFVARLSKKVGLSVTGFTPAAADAMSRYRWPGNVRELENAIERAVVLADGERFDVSDLPEEVRAGAARAPASEALEDVERAHILAVLEAHRGNRTHAAEALKIGTATLYRKLRAYGVLV